MTEFPVAYGLRFYWLDVAFCAFLFASLVSLAWLFKRRQLLSRLQLSVASLFLIGLFGFFTILLFGGWVFLPQAYQVSDDELIIKLPQGAETVTLSRFISFNQLPPSESKRERLIPGRVKDNMRLGFSYNFSQRELSFSQPIGIVGRFWTNGYGRVRFYASDLRRSVLLTGQEDSVLVTPRDPEGFITLINSKRGSAKRGSR